MPCLGARGRPFSGAPLHVNRWNAWCMTLHVDRFTPDVRHIIPGVRVRVSLALHVHLYVCVCTLPQVSVMSCAPRALSDQLPPPFPPSSQRSHPYPASRLCHAKSTSNLPPPPSYVSVFSPAPLHFRGRVVGGTGFGEMLTTSPLNKRDPAATQTLAWVGVLFTC